MALSADTWQVQVHELIGRGVAEARRSQGLTQEQLARRFQGRGLTCLAQRHCRPA